MNFQQIALAMDAVGAVCQVVLLSMLTGAGHWILARSAVMFWFWGRATGWFDQLLRCPACSGFWLGGIAWLCGIRPLDAFMPWWPLSLVGTAILATLGTPVAEAVLLWGLGRAALGTPDDDGDPTNDVGPEADTDGNPGVHQSSADSSASSS
jgi:hypothetical protein